MAGVCAWPTCSTIPRASAPCSADRANAARLLMQQSGLQSDQVSQVRGFADQRLRTPQDPLEPSNRRISIIVQYLGAESDSDGPSAPPANEPKKD